MRKWQRFAVFLIILVPLMVGLTGHPITTALEHTRAMQQLQQARYAGDTGAEITAIEEVLAFSPWRGDLWQRAGRLYLDTGQADRAISTFDHSGELGQLDAQGHIWLADALITDGRLIDARNSINSAGLGDYFLLMQAAALLRKAGDLEGARENLIKANQLEPEDDEVNYQIGVLTLIEEPEKAYLQLQKIQAGSPKRANAQYLVETINSKNEFNSNIDWILLAGQALSRVGEWDAAMQAFQTVVEDDPENALAWALLGEAQQQNNEGGKVSLDRAIELDADGELVNALMGLYYRRQGNTEQALVYLERALSANPKAAVWRIEMGGTLADAGRLEEALTQYQSGVEIDRSNPENWSALAKFSIGRNYMVQESGLGAARQAVVLSPDNPVYLDLLGSAYMILGDLDNAERFFKQALERDAEQAAILIHLGQVSYSRGQKEAAFAYWRRASASASNDRLKEMAERLLQENNAR